MGIRTRIAVFVAAIVAAVVSVGSTAFLLDFSSGLHGSLEAALRNRAERIVHAASGQVLADPSTRLFSAAVADAGQSVTQLLAPDGAVTVATPAAGEVSLVSASVVARARHGTVFVERRVPNVGGSWLLLVAPWPDGGTLVTGRSLDTVHDAVSRAQLDTTVAAVAAVLAAAMGGWLITGWALRPVERLRAEAAAIVDGDSDRSLPVPRTGDELAALAVTLNTLISRWYRLLTRQRELVSAASHELRTPLAALHTELELARQGDLGEHGDLGLALDRAMDRSRYLARLASDLLLLAEADEGANRPEGTPQPVEPVVAAVLEDWRGRARARDVMLVLDVEGDPESVVNAERLRQVVDNLVANAMRFAPPGTGVEIRVSGDDSRVLLAVTDRGPGFPPDFLPRAFERFSRPASSRGRADGGAGLGLAIVRAIAEAYGGRAVAANRRGGGAEVTVELPSGAG